MIFKGYVISGATERTNSIFRTTETFNTVKEFLENEENFKEWVEEYLEEEEIKEFSKLEQQEQQRLMNKYNENDELCLFYSFSDIDNEEIEINKLKEVIRNEFLEANSDIIEDDKESLKGYSYVNNGFASKDNCEDINIDELKRGYEQNFKEFVEINDIYLILEEANNFVLKIGQDEIDLNINCPVNVWEWLI